MYMIICMIACLALVTEGNGNINTEENSLLCPEVLLSNLIFTLYTQNNIQDGTILTQDTLNQVDTNNYTIIIIHGYNENTSLGWNIEMKNSHLNKSPVNVITVNWDYYAWGPYPEAAVCIVPQVGVLVGDLIYNLTQIGLDVKKLQFNGFSLGAHISGFAANRVYNLTQVKVNRINGLDAAAIEFVGKPITERLDATDADFVQAIHTHGAKYGFPDNYGSIDFYVNYTPVAGCGSLQYGCPMNPGVPITPGIIIDNELCDHYRAVAYFIESINSNNFIGRQCASCTEFGLGLCTYPTVKTIMGENCPSTATGVRYLNSNFNAPFAQG